jgi:hypothetical protein
LPTWHAAASGNGLKGFCRSGCIPDSHPQLCQKTPGAHVSGVTGRRLLEERTGFVDVAVAKSSIAGTAQ